MKKFKRYTFNKGKPKSTKIENMAVVFMIFLTIFCLFLSMQILNGNGVFSMEWVPNFILSDAQRYTGVSPVFREKIVPVIVLVLSCKYIVFFVTIISRNWNGYIEWAQHHKMIRIIISIFMVVGVFYAMPHMFGHFYIPSVAELPRGIAGFGVSLFNGEHGLFFLFFFSTIASYATAASFMLFFAKLRSYF